MTKTGGLADSPFFRPPTPLPAVNSPAFPAKPQMNATSSPANSSEGKNERRNVTTLQQTSEKPPRVVIRHTFDIYQDQLIRLQKIQIAVMSRGRRKPKLGKMVQKALDLYLLREEKRHPQELG